MPTGVYLRTEYHRACRTGWKHAEEARRKMSKSRMGHPSYTAGKKIHTEKTKEASRQRMIGNKYSLGQTPWNKGKGRGKDKEKERIRIKRYRELGLTALYLRNTRAKRKLAEGKLSSAEWFAIKKEYGFTCPSCFLKEPEIKLSIDHVVPLSRGGRNDAPNIQPLCYECNRKKHTKTIRYEKPCLA